MSKQLIHTLCLGVFWLSCAGHNVAQDNPVGGQPRSLEGYLQQAFAAPQAENRLALAHIGIQGEGTSNGFLVTAVLEGYPAFNGGIYRGDVIETAAGEPFHPITSFTSHAGETISLTIRRDDNTLTLSVQPVLENLYDSYRTATINSIQEFSAGNKVIGYIRPWALSKNTADLISFAKLMEQLSHCDALIFDLRNAYGFADQLHSDSLMSNENGPDHFEKSVVILFNEETAEGPMDVIKKVMHLSRIDTLGAATHLGVAPEMTIPYPKTQTSRFDPQYNAALNRLLGII
jgi:hypothetical protein